MGARIRAERERAGVSQGELGKLVGVSQQSVAKWEAGGNVTATRLQAIASVLHIPVGLLLGEGINEASIEVGHVQPASGLLDGMRKNLVLLGDATEALVVDFDAGGASRERLASLLEVLDRVATDAAAVRDRLGDLPTPGPEDLAEAKSILDQSAVLSDRLQHVLHELNEMYEHRIEADDLLRAAKAADPDEQTVERATRPGADAPEEEGAP